ncbi:MAG TPA: hypothetical protein VF473_02735 [Cyclobacteriaceae bacterium]
MKKKKLQTITGIVLFFGLLTVEAQSPAGIYLPEQISMHLDKDFYFTGDHLWYSLYLNNAPRATGSLSVIAYVELRDSRDSVVFRQKVKCREGLAHGDWLIPGRLLTGNYKITAFTLWAKNLPENIFSKTLLIVNPDIVLPPVSATANNIAAPKDVGGNGLLKLSVSKNSVRPNERITVSFDLSDPGGLPLTGSFSVSVRLKTSFTEGRQAVKEIIVSAGRPSMDEILGSQPTARAYNKEMFISPETKGTLKPLSNLNGITPYRADIDEHQMKDVLAMGMLKKIIRSYHAEPFYERDLHYNVPSNISYQPASYTALPSLSEFIKEIVPQIKVRKTKSGRQMFVRSIGSSAGVFYYKEPALVLVDGRIVEDVEAILEMGLREVERVDITWDNNDINNLGLFSLADNGVISFTTNSRNRFRDGYREVFKDFNSPLLFSTKLQVGKDDKVPHLSDPLYWNPLTRIVGKTKLEFEMGDNPGEYIVEVVGITNQGLPLFASTTITVPANE